MDGVLTGLPRKLAAHRTPFEMRSSAELCHYGNILRYKATAGQDAYERNRQSCCRHYDFFEKSNFISFVEQKFFEERWSLDTCIGRALEDELFTRDQIVCTKTRYGYINLGLLGIKNIDFPEKLHRSPKKSQIHKNKRISLSAQKIITMMPY